VRPVQFHLHALPDNPLSVFRPTLQPRQLRVLQSQISKGKFTELLALSSGFHHVEIRHFISFYLASLIFDMLVPSSARARRDSYHSWFSSLSLNGEFSKITHNELLCRQPLLENSLHNSSVTRASYIPAVLQLLLLLLKRRRNNSNNSSKQ